MLTDAALRNFKPKSLIYKASDRDGMYVTVSPGGYRHLPLRLPRLNGRRETLTIGRYGPGGISLAMARELLLDARKAVLRVYRPRWRSSVRKRRVVAIKTFGAAMGTRGWPTQDWPTAPAPCASIIDRDILPVFQNRLLTEIRPKTCVLVQQGQGARSASHGGTDSGHRETGLCLRHRPR